MIQSTTNFKIWYLAKATDNMLPRTYKCGKCKKDFAMDYARINHEKNCVNRKKLSKKTR